MNRKLIVFKDNETLDIDKKCYVKFLDEDKKYAIFYNPLVAPSNLKEYLKENDIKEAYEVSSLDAFNMYKDKIYTFESVNGIYKVTKGYFKKDKYVFFVDAGMSVDLGLLRYCYTIKDNYLFLKKFKGIYNKDYCYVTDRYLDYLKDFMIKTEELVPGILKFCDEEGKIDKNTKKKHLDI